MPKLSIIIPCLNEEKNISKLLRSIKAQNFPCEVIVADGGSSDSTVKLAKKYGARIVRVPKPGCPAKGRNYGAKSAKSELLLFFDADVIPKKGFFKSCYAEFKRENLGSATCYAKPLSKKTVDFIFYGLANAWMFAFKNIRPYAQGFCIFALKKIHNRIKGFDESISFGEDSEYILRARKFGKFNVLRTPIFVSVRRFEKEGRFWLSLKYTYLNFFRLFGKELRKDVGYKFGHYN